MIISVFELKKHENLSKYQNTIQIGNCILHPRNRSRCKNYLTCSMYEQCLDAVAELDWYGWSAKSSVPEE